MTFAGRVRCYARSAAAREKLADVVDVAPPATPFVPYADRFRESPKRRNESIDSDALPVGRHRPRRRGCCGPAQMPLAKRFDFPKDLLDPRIQTLRESKSSTFSFEVISTSDEPYCVLDVKVDDRRIRFCCCQNPQLER
jgi:hypothetical protein